MQTAVGWLVFALVTTLPAGAILVGLYLQVDGLRRLWGGVQFHRTDPTPVGDIGGQSGFVEFEGTALLGAGEEPVTAPFSERPCAYCQYQVAVFNRGNDSSGYKIQFSDSAGTPLRVSDHTGTALVEIGPSSTVRADSDRVGRTDRNEAPPESLVDRLWADDSVPVGEHPVLVADDRDKRIYREKRVGAGDEVHVIGEPTGETGPNGEPVLEVTDLPGCLAVDDAEHPATESLRTGVAHLLIGLVALGIGGAFAYGVITEVATLPVVV